MPAGITFPVLRNRNPIMPPRTALVPNDSAKLLGFFVVWYAPYPSNDPNTKPADKLGMLAINKIQFYFKHILFKYNAEIKKIQ